MTTPMDLLPFLHDNLWSLLVLGGNFVLWRWSLAGWRHLAQGSAAHIFRLRNSAVTVGLASTFVVTLGSMPAVGLFTPYWAAALGSVAVAMHAALDPSKPTFWHHRRIRPLFALAVVVLGYFLARYTPQPALVPALYAAAVFHRHQRGGVGVITQCFTDLDALRAKVVALETDRALRQQNQAKNGDRRQAG